ncbi:MAG: hypothetical protein A2503_05275 [Burkholderiales bacterium RIFOXYD12_FULL_59_19]|nr:MAG: hypothetical protein A2503_05275 [Burkholderiales bacterium RIFOXYD12_FULL_59_19]
MSILSRQTQGRVPANYLQTQTTECGLAALAMLLGHFGRFVTLDELRQVSGVSRDCVNAADLVRTARHYGLAVRVLQREPHQLAALGFPLIVYLHFIHFAVVENVTATAVWLNDPACGRHRVPQEEFNESYTGIALSFATTADFQPGGTPPSLWRSVRRYLVGSSPAKWLLALLAGSLVSLPVMVFAGLLAQAADQLAGTTQINTTSLWPTLAGLLGALVLAASLQTLHLSTLTQLEQQLSRSRLAALTRHLFSLPYAFFVYRIPAVLHQRIYDQEQVHQVLCRHLVPGISSLPALAILMAALLYVDAGIGTAVAAAMLVYGVVLALVFAGKAASLRRHSDQDDVAWMKLSQAVRNFESFKTSGGDREFFSGSLDGVANLLKLRQEFGGYHGLSELLPDLFVGLMLLLSLVLAHPALTNGRLSFGDLMAVLVLLLALLEPLRRLSRLHGKLDALGLILPQIEDLREQQAPGTAPVNTAPQRSDFILSATQISFGFSRAKAPLLHAVSVHIRPGEHIGITGPSGGGKSTLAELLIGLHQPWQGEVRLDGHLTGALPPGQLSRDIAWVNKHPFFFAGTVRDNLCLWQADIRPEQLQRAIDDACLDDVLAACPAGLDTPLAPRAANFSGGQRQRLEIARALLRNPRILLLDEATDGLDHALEQRLRANLKRRGLTLIVVSHRLSTLAACDRVLRLVGGRLVTDDTVVLPTHTPVLSDFTAEEDPLPPPQPPGDRRAALIDVFGRVANAIGVRDITPPPQALPLDGPSAPARGLEALARHNRLPLRPLRFVVAQWWQRDHGPLIAFTRGGMEPVALLPGAGGTYQIVNPTKQTQERLTPASAQTLQSSAYQLYARFEPDRSTTALRPWGFFLHALAQLKPDLRSALLASVALAVLALGLPLAAYALLAEVLPFAQPVMLWQWQAGLVWLAVALISFEAIRLLALLRLEGRLALSASSALFQHVMRVQALLFRDHSPQEIARSLNAVPRVLAVLRSDALRRLSAVLAAATGLALMTWFSGTLALVALLLWLPLLLVPTGLVRAGNTWVHAHFAQRLEGLQLLRQMLDSAGPLRQAGRDQAALAHWERSYATEHTQALRMQRSEVRAQSFANTYPWLALTGFVAVMALQHDPAKPPDVAVLAALLLAFMLATLALQGCATALAEVLRAWPLLDRLQPLATAPTEPPAAAAPADVGSQGIEVRNLSFSYPGSTQATLKDLSLRIEPGQLVALAGPSGSGKSTFLRLLLGFHVADAGGILRAGQPHLNTHLSAWRDQVGAVLQDDQLEAAMSVRGHIMGHHTCTMAEIRQAARLAMLEPDIDAMPMGIQSIVDSDKVSTGQKQRILIARRLLRQPKLLILDEATNALPEDMQAGLLVNLRQLGLTCLLVTHRASVLAAADVVYLMGDGRITWSGTPKAFAAAGHARAMGQEDSESE